MHTPLTVHACSYYPPKQANTKAALLTVNTHHYGNLQFYTMHLSVQFNHFNCAHCMGCRTSGASEATPAVAEASGRGSYLYFLLSALTAVRTQHRFFDMPKPNNDPTPIVFHRQDQPRKCIPTPKASVASGEQTTHNQLHSPVSRLREFVRELLGHHIYIETRHSPAYTSYFWGLFCDAVHI